MGSTDGVSQKCHRHKSRSGNRVYFEPESRAAGKHMLCLYLLPMTVGAVHPC